MTAPNPKILHYGDNNTIHGSTDVNVELDATGNVVSVWFRCMRLPFTQTVVDAGRAAEMLYSYKNEPTMPITAIDFVETDKGA